MYTLGDMARKRQEIIRQLKEEGVFDLQRELCIPRFAKRIAVISAEGAAGYGDFCRQLEDNEYGFKFEVTLFPAIMQGEQVESSVRIGTYSHIAAIVHKLIVHKDNDDTAGHVHQERRYTNGYDIGNQLFLKFVDTTLQMQNLVLV